MSDYTGMLDMASDTTLARIAGSLDRDLISQLDGTAATYKRVMRQWFIAQGIDTADPDAETLTALCDQWYALTRDQWCGYTEFYNTDVSSVSTGTKGGDNADLTCTPSTDTVEGTDDYAGLPLFACVDCNWEIDAESLDIVITAIEGVTNNFKRTDTSVFVGVLQMAPYYIAEDGDSTYIRGLSAVPVPYAYCAPAPEAVRVDGTLREWVCHAKYMSAPSTMTCCSGTVAGGYFSHNNTHTRSLALGTGYSGSTSADDMWLKMMTYVKYGSLSMSDIMGGTTSLKYQYAAQVAEEGVKRIILSTSNASTLEVGMRVLAGYYDSSLSSPLDRSASAVYSYTGQTGALITSIKDVTIDDVDYSAVYLDVDDTFDTAANGSATDGTSYLSTWAWDTGTTDSVKGNDGSPVSCTDYLHPAKLQGIEWGNGVGEIITDAIYRLYFDDDGETRLYQPYVCRLRANQSASITDDYEATGVVIARDDDIGSYGYVKRLSSPETGVMVPIEIGTSSSAYARAPFYTISFTEEGTLVWISMGWIATGGCWGTFMYTYTPVRVALSDAHWYVGGRISPNGNRGAWSA